MTNSSQDIPIIPTGSPAPVPTIMPENPEALSPEEMRRAINDYRIRLASLEIENGKLRAERNEAERLHRECADVYEHFPAGYILLDSNGMIRGINGAGTTLLGETRETLVGQLFFRYVLPEDRDVLREHIEAVRTETRTVELRLKKEPARAVLLSSLLAEDGIRTSVIDISEQKRQEMTAATKGSEDHAYDHHLLNTIMECLPEGIIFVAAADDRIGRVSRYFEKIAGFSRKKIIGMPIAEGFSRIGANRVGESGMPTVSQSPLFRTVHTGEKVTNEEWTITRPDGTVAAIIINAAPVLDATGTITGGVSVWRDISARRRGELVLRESEERYRSLSSIISDYAFSFRVDPGPVIVNEWMTEGFLRITGYTIEELELHGGILSITFPEDADIPAEAIKKLLSHETDMRVEYRFVAKNGDVRWLNVSARSVWSEEMGRIVRFYGAAQDITDRKRIEESLRESEERYRRIVETAEEGVWMIDETDRISYANGEFAGMLGYTVEEMIGKSVFDLTDKESAPLLRQNLQLRREGHRGQYEIRFRRKNGSDVWVMVSATPVFDKNGNFSASFAMLTDITERKRMEEELTAARDELEERVWQRTVELERAIKNLRAQIAERERAEAEREQAKATIEKREREFETLVETAPDVITQFDRNLHLVYINRAVENESGLPVRSFSSKSASDLQIPDSITRQWREKLNSVIETGHEETIETVVDLPVGKRWYFSRLAPVLTADGSVDSVLGISHNITELKNAEEELRHHREHLEELVEERTNELEHSNEQLRDEITERKRVEEQITRLNDSLRRQTAQLMASNKELEAFSYSVSHDLRSPLRSIDGFSLALMEDYTDRLDDTGKDYLQRIRTSTQRMGQLIEDILNLSRVARTEMRHTDTDLSAMANEIAAELRKSDPERDVEAVIQDNIIARGDPSLLRLVLENLFGNAWKFTKYTSHPRIEFSRTENDGQTIYIVHDNGAGFDMRYMDKLFSPFQRLHTKEEFPGTGIGLAIVRRIVQRHGGRVWAEGEPGKGASFFFTLQ